jgi:hypothetical protein
MSNLFDGARQIAHILLGSKEKNQDTINSTVNQILNMSDYNGIDKVKLIEQLIADFEIYTGDPTMLSNEDVKPWLINKLADLEWPLWKRYKALLMSKDPSFPINSLDDVSNKILDKCFDPKVSGAWDRRGMVVGHVQSGKTSNYIGLVNKAVDAGYKLIIVIAGIHNSLRSQTQLRVDEGFIGRKSADFLELQRNIKIGVGKYQVGSEIYSYTSSAYNGDFNKAMADRLSVPIGGTSPTILVIKKNKSVLENLIDWLARHATETGNGLKVLNIPLLVIDDEADNASVNSGDSDDIRTINKLIRTLLNLFQQDTFIGYTATPYANLFIPDEWNEDIETTINGRSYQVGEDLFPRDFIVNIPAPSNYIGAARLFGYENTETGEGSDGLPIVRLVDDQEPYFPEKLTKENRAVLPDDLPATLYKAIQCFILTCAIRRVRGQETKHNSMLIHVALYVAWIDRISFLVNEVLRDYKNQINSGHGPIYDTLEKIFAEDYIPTTANTISSLNDYFDPAIQPCSWDEVKSELKKAASKIEVRAVHGTKNTSQLDYHNVEEINYDASKEDGLSVIAVGGNRLARGITLEGLSISYYLRTSKMYDALMQMGRWFGYRPGYVDLCRIFTTELLIRWYRHVTLATQEMRADFDELAAQNGKKPRDYQLKVRTHSGLLSITSASRMRSHEIIRVGFSGDVKQTYEFSKDSKTIKRNFDAVQSLVQALPKPDQSQANKLSWVGDFGSDIITFIENYSTEQPNIKKDVLTAYIKKQMDRGNLRDWAIAVRSNTQASTTYPVIFNGIGSVNIGLTTRSDTGSGIYSLSKQNIQDPPDTYFDLDLKPEKGKSFVKKDIVHAARENCGRGLLVIYPLDPSKVVGVSVDIPITGFYLAFPKVPNEELVEFAARIIPGFDYEQEDDEID